MVPEVWRWLKALPVEGVLYHAEKIRQYSNGTIVFTNGVFDLFHAGHLYTLAMAQEQGDHLIVGVNSDLSTRGIKPGRPVIDEKDRARIVTAIRGVDSVFVFDDPTPCEIIRKLKPDVYVKGRGWTRETLPETEIVEGYGGRVHIVEGDLESTTAIIERIRRLP